MCNLSNLTLYKYVTFINFLLSYIWNILLFNQDSIILCVCLFALYCISIWGKFSCQAIYLIFLVCFVLLKRNSGSGAILSQYHYFPSIVSQIQVFSSMFSHELQTYKSYFCPFSSLIFCSPQLNTK